MIKAAGIYKSYKQSRKTLDILKGIDLEIAEGEFISIVGPSGAGKSTLLHILGGLDQPNQGTVVLDNENVYKLKDEARARLRNRKVGFVFQFYHLLPEFTALENVILPLLVREDKVNTKAFEPKGKELLRQVGLEKRMTHKPNQLSGGEQQRVAIARALVNDPKIIFSDEPTGNLDSQSGKEIIQLLMDLNNKNKQTLVIVTHDEHIAQFSSRRMRMKDGELV
ncbi:MAG: ABC transporter ATP-binding protein [Candidatus Omnitrophica bacterium]|nr:ABC transporter ATP-binding protein [Candidatus Omnitrophota bacterium]MCB9747592.1 ABC transporter ATP-binding protein [Candidatus Omnitrophota bacterium]